jgi:hypothetical protein
MQRQGSFLQAEYARKKKPTRRDKFLAEMEAVVPWARLVQRLQPLYPRGERGRPPIGLERMLRVYLVQLSMPRSLPPRPRPRTRRKPAIPKCTRPRRATSGISG